MDGVVREYGSGQARVVAVREACLRIERREVVVVCGQSGAGKSSLLQIAGCLAEPTRSPSRSLPLAVAVCAVMAAASVAGVPLHSADQHNARTYAPRLLDGQAMLNGPLPADDAALRPVARALGGARIIRLSHAAMPTGDGPVRLTLDNPARRCARPLPGGVPEQCPKESGAGLIPFQDVAVADEDLIATATATWLTGYRPNRRSPGTV